MKTLNNLSIDLFISGLRCAESGLVASPDSWMKFTQNDRAGPASDLVCSCDVGGSVLE